jgi:hypothetical protein
MLAVVKQGTNQRILQKARIAVKPEFAPVHYFTRANIAIRSQERKQGEYRTNLDAIVVFGAEHLAA